MLHSFGFQVNMRIGLPPRSWSHWLRWRHSGTRSGRGVVVQRALVLEPFSRPLCSFRQRYEKPSGHQTAGRTIPKPLLATRMATMPPPVDFRYVRDHLDQVKENIARRGVDADAAQVAQLYDRFCALTAETDQVRRERNKVAARMKNMKQLTAQEREQCIALGKELKERVSALEAELVKVEQQLHEEGARLPNRTHPDVPVGDEDQARVLSIRGHRREFSDFTPLNHLDLALQLDLVDFEAAAKVSGARFYFLRNAGAMLELALVNWTMQRLVGQHGFTPLMAPDLVREEIVRGCGFQPRGEASQIYTVADMSLCLAGTAEIPLGGYYANQILDEQQLPLKMAAMSHCFRREVGAAGTETRGLYRVHQFTKVEMFVISRPEESDQLHEELRRIEEELFDALGLHYRVLDMPTRDLGNPAYRKFDIEAWMPGRQAFGEISSASNCTDYQARRLNIRYRERESEKIRFVHTLNATACAVPRMIISILENYQNKDGTVSIPPVLRPFMGGLERIQAPAHSAVATATAELFSTQPKA